MASGDCAARQKLHTPAKRLMPGQKVGQERVLLRRTVAGNNIPGVLTDYRKLQVLIVG